MSSTKFTWNKSKTNNKKEKKEKIDFDEKEEEVNPEMVLIFRLHHIVDVWDTWLFVYLRTENYKARGCAVQVKCARRPRSRAL